MFPAGAAGIALLTLRLTLIAMLLLWTVPSLRVNDSSWVLFFLGSTVICLSLGVYTPAACAICCVIEILTSYRFQGVPMYQAALLVPLTVSLAILGPGAFSLDSRLFGRRRIVVSNTLKGPDL